MSSEGFGFRWEGCYWASLTLNEPSSGGRQDVYFGPVGTDPHHHSWVKWSEGQLTEIGARLKDPSLAPRPPSHQTTGFSTETLARFRAVLDPDRGCVTTEIADVFSGSAYSAAPSESARTQSKRVITMLDVSVPEAARVIEGELAYCYAPPGGTPQSLSTQVAYLPLSSDHTVGIAMHITGWSSG